MTKANAKLSEIGFNRKVEKEATKIHEGLEHYQEMLSPEQFAKFWKAIASRVKEKLS